MQYAHLGRTGLKVSRLTLGTWNFGTFTDESEAFRILDTALEAGINVIDTANHYPDFVNCGRSEEFIGRWFDRGGDRRRRVVLATKVYQPMRDPVDGPNDEPGLSKYIIRRHAEGSLRRLRTDHIDLYQMHHIDHRACWDEVWEAFEGLVQQGKIAYVGSSNFAGWHLARAQAQARARGFLGLVSEQHRYNLMGRLPELEVLPAARACGIGILVYSPLAGGLLAGDIADAPEGSRRAGLKQGAEAHQARLDAFADLCRSLGEKEADVALAWLLTNPAVTSVVLGPRTAEQVTESLRSVEIELSEETLQRLNEIFPGPGGPAPEAYAW